MRSVKDMLWNRMVQIQRASANPIRPMTLKALTQTNSPGESACIKSSEWVRSELVTRLAQCLATFHQLPYLAAANPHFNHTYDMYADTFQTLKEMPIIKNSQQKNQFCEYIFEERKIHDSTVDNLGRGLKQIHQISPEIHLNDFLEKLFRNRLSRRIMIEHLHGMMNPLPGWAGCVMLKCNPLILLEDAVANVSESCRHSYGIAPKVIIEEVGSSKLSTTQDVVDVSMTMIPDHVAVVITEILKNSMRATVEFYTLANSVAMEDMENNTCGKFRAEYGIFDSDDLPPITVSVFKSLEDDKLMIRFSDKGGGIAPEVADTMWDFGYTSTDDSVSKMMEQNTGSMMGGGGFIKSDMAGYGFGLPLSRTIARHFSGDIDIHSIWGVGTEVTLTIGNLADEV